MTGKQLKNSILQWAIQGKLVPQDPNDEPASVLLEKIRAEKARLVKEGKIKKDKKESIIYRGDDNSHYEKFADGTVVCIDDEIPFDVPNGWEWFRMQDVIEFINGRAYKKEELLEKGKYKVLRVGNFFTNDSWYYSNLELPDDKYCYNGDLLYAWSASFGPQIWNGDKTIFHYHIWNVKYNAKILFREYLYYFLLADKAKIKGSTTGSTMIHVSMENMKPRFLPIPPLEEQKRIVAKIQELLPIVDVFANCQNRLNTLNENIKPLLRKSILQEAIQGKLVPQDPADEPASVLLERIKEEKQRLLKEGKLKKKDVVDSVIFKGDDNRYYEQIGGEVVDITEDIPFDIPDGWAWCRLKSVCTIFTGATFKKEDASTNKQGIRILRGGNILPFEITFKEDDIFLPCDFVKKNILLQKNDIVTPAVTSLENIGKMAHVKNDLPNVTVGGFVFVLRLYYPNDWLSRYLLALMSSPTIIEYMKSITNKSGQAFYNIGKERLATTLLPIPPLSEQQRIVNQIEKIFNEIKGN